MPRHEARQRGNQRKFANGGRWPKLANFPGRRFTRGASPRESEHFPALARQLTSSAGRTRVSATVEGFFVAALSGEHRLNPFWRAGTLVVALLGGMLSRRG